MSLFISMSSVTTNAEKNIIFKGKNTKFFKPPRMYILKDYCGKGDEK